MLRQEIKEKFIEFLAKQGKVDDTSRQLLANFESFADLENRVDKRGWFEVEELAQAKAEFFKLPYIDLVGEKINPVVLNTLPKELAENYNAVVYRKDAKTLSAAIVEPGDLKAQEAIEFLARERGLKAKFSACSKASFDEALKQYVALKSEVAEFLGAAEEKFSESQAALESVDGKPVSDEDDVSSAPIAKMVSVILKHAVEERASDIHIEPVLNQTRVRYRVDGVLKTSLMLPKYVHSAIVSRIKVMAKLKIDETRVPQDGRIRLKIDGQNIDFRISTLPLYRNEKVVMRILDSSGDALTLEELGYDGRNLEVIQENIAKPNGMFLVTGPTGSGKTTTLYSVLQILNKEGVNIITLEDPVEYYLKGVNQSQINPDVGLTFATGLRSILRQDPDIIMVGEIRDSETGELAIHAALTGHIVLSTLHTNDAFGAIPRLVDLKVEPFLLSSTLNVVVAQRLVRRLCQDCKKPVQLPETLYNEAAAELKKVNPISIPKGISPKKKLVFWKGQGCQRCGNSGYKGRIAIAEVLSITDELKTVIATTIDYQKIKDIFYDQGMITVKQDGVIKALQGLTTVEEVIRATKE